MNAAVVVRASKPFGRRYTFTAASLSGGAGAGTTLSRLHQRLRRAAFLNLFGPFTAARRLFQRIAIQLRQKSFRGCAQVFHCVSPILFACASQSQMITGRIPDVAKSTARERNLTAREGNYAC